MYRLSIAMLLAALAGCNSKPDPQLTADQMTMTDATCAPAETAKILDADVRKKFEERCARRAAVSRPPA